MYDDKSHVGMSNCYVCGEPACVLLETRIRNGELLKTLDRNMGPLGPDDLCHACQKKAKTMACLIGVTEGAITADEDRCRWLKKHNDQERDSRKRCRVFPYPFRADGLLAWVRLAVLDQVLEGGVKKWLVGPVMFCQLETRNVLLTKLSGSSIEDIMAAADKADPGVETDAITLRGDAEQPKET